MQATERSAQAAPGRLSDERYNSIRGALVAKGCNLTDIANRAGCSTTHVIRTLREPELASPAALRVRAAIAAVLGPDNPLNGGAA